MSELQDAIKRVAQTVNNPACHWSDWDGKNAFVDPGVADMQTILAALAAAPDGDMITPPEPDALLARVRSILDGIDREEDDRDGWWETSFGAKFGAGRLAKLLEAIAAPAPEPVG